LDKNDINTVVEKTVRGLYFHHTGNIIPESYPAKVYCLQSLDDELFQLSDDWDTGTVGDPALIYKYAKCIDDPIASFWVLQFFQKVWLGVSFLPEE
jgi:hypothetical protein